MARCCASPSLHRRLAACALGALLVAAPTVRASDGDARGRVDTLIGPAPCHVDGDCRSSPVGQQACGGPAGFVAWSARHTQPDALHAALAAHDAALRQRAVPGDRLSTCQVKVDPGAYCERPRAAGDAPGRCTLRPAAHPVGGAAPTR